MRIRNVPLYKLIPNLITVAGLCLGISALRYALDQKFMVASGLILTAVLMDFLDGRLARLLKCESDFGAQLDSLADIVSFGVAPALVCYLWSLHHIPYFGVGWSIVLFFITCSALRLARFNVENQSATGKNRSKTFFTGVPAPVAAALGLMPMISTFEVLPAAFYSPWSIAGYLLFLGLLMISRIPTFSAKNLVIAEKYIPWVHGFFCLLTIATVLEPWRTIPCLGFCYLLSIPISMWRAYSHV